MNRNISRSTLYKWLTFICNGYVDSLGNFITINFNTLDLRHLNTQDKEHIVKVLQRMKKYGLTASDRVASQHSPYRIYPAYSVANHLCLSDKTITKELSMFLKRQFRVLYENGAFENNENSQSVTDLYIIEVIDTNRRFIVDGENRLLIILRQLNNEPESCTNAPAA